MKALVVDDNNVNLMILVNMLEQYHIKAYQADHGEKAIEMAFGNGYDLIFIDHIMPDMDGVNTVKEIRNNQLDEKKPVIVALTSNLTEDILDLYMEAGADRICTKPLELTELISLLKVFYPEFQIYNLSSDQACDLNTLNCEMKAVLSTVEYLDIREGLSKSMGNSVQYLNLLRATLRDIQRCVMNMKEYKNYQPKEDVRLAVHSLKGIFTIIGASSLAGEAQELESSISDTYQDFYIGIKEFLNKVEGFGIQLKNALAQCELIQQSMLQKHLSDIKQMTKKEYEQCLLDAIYYIKRYEYSASLKELEKLIMRGYDEFKEDFELAYAELKEFEYEKAFSRLSSIM